MKTLWICAAAVTLSLSAYAQDTTSVPVKQGDPEVRQSPEQMQQAMLQDMIKISSSEVPEKVQAAVRGSEFRGTKTYYKHTKKDEYAVEIKDGEISSFHFFDKNGQPRNKQK
ncbi:MAG: hypothetical protein QM762_02395 [Chryseolinea sp.]